MSGDISKLGEIELDEANKPKWGIAMGWRYAQSAFDAEDDDHDDLFPEFYYEGERLFMRGHEGGYRLWSDEAFNVSALGRYRFTDVPDEYQMYLDDNALDLGLQLSWQMTDDWALQADVLSDMNGRMHGAIRLATEWQQGRFSATPALELKVNSSRFNTRYYGFDEDDVDGGLEYRARIEGKMHLVSNAYLTGSVEAGFLGSDARSSAFVDKDYVWEGRVGVGFFEAPSYDPKNLLAQPYLRLAYGWGTSSGFERVILGETDTDGSEDEMMTLFYGHPLADEFFGLPIEVYLTAGVGHHFDSDDQGAATEYILAFKAYYTFPLPWRVRLGVAEGLSYVDGISYYEQFRFDDKGDETSELLNFIDVSLDLNMGDVFKCDQLDSMWLGYSVHHRSGIFNASSAFNNASGGSNYSSLYLQWNANF